MSPGIRPAAGLYMGLRGVEQMEYRIAEHARAYADAHPWHGDLFDAADSLTDHLILHADQADDSPPTSTEIHVWIEAYRQRLAELDVDAPLVVSR